jgi:hypothetical protein
MPTQSHDLIRETLHKFRLPIQTETILDYTYCKTNYSMFLTVCCLNFYHLGHIQFLFIVLIKCLCFAHNISF